MKSILQAALAVGLVVTACQAQAPGILSEDAELRGVLSHIRTRTYDKIPAIDYPRFVSAEKADRFLKPNEMVVGVVIRNLTKAYPVKFLDGREVVNDSLARNPITVTC